MEIIESLKHLTTDVLHRKKPKSDLALRRDQHSEYDVTGHTLSSRDTWILEGEHGAVTLTIEPGGVRKVQIHHLKQWAEDSTPHPITGLWAQCLPVHPTWEFSVHYPDSIHRYLKRLYESHLQASVVGTSGR